IANSSYGTVADSQLRELSCWHSRSIRVNSYHLSCLACALLPPWSINMLTLLGRSHRYCDGLSRRSFLRVGSLALGGLTLPNLLRAEARAATQSTRSVIMVYLTGGLAHQDTFDLKPNAPAEVRGEFKPIDTNVPGIQISEHLPKLAKCMDKMVLLRAITGLQDEHSSFQTTTGFGMN